MGIIDRPLGASTPSRARRLRAAALVSVAAILGTAFAVAPSSTPAQAASPCGATINPIVCENTQLGTDPAVWDISGAGDSSIQGFATDISVNAGQRIDFKIDTDAAAYTIDIYRTGWYQGLGARRITSVTPSATLPQHQPECVTDVAVELYDCGTWGVSASWNVPAAAVSGVYVAKLTRTDTGGASHITFIVRKDGNTSDVLFQTSDPTWHAYNTYGGSDFYQGASNGRAYEISYNRPFATRDGITQRDFYFSSEYATVRFLERNGYDVSYIAGVDTDRRGSELLKHKVFLSVGHDEYWSGAQRANITAARDAGVHLQFLTGNEGYWRTRYAASADSSHTPNRTLVSYKETWSNAKVDPSDEWTGTWRDPRFADASQGGHLPENALSGTMYVVNNVDLPVRVSAAEGKFRLWRNTNLTSLAAGTSASLAAHTVGYESNEIVDNGFSPSGLIRLSTTVGPTPQYLTDYGNTVAEGTTEHHLTLYKAASGALVFSAGSIQWGWGLDAEHDGDGAPADVRMQQAQVNLFADMGVQPGSRMTGLASATKSTDTTAPTAVVQSPAEGAHIAHGKTVTATGTASDTQGRVAGVQVSTDAGATWHAAVGTTSWTYTYVQQGAGPAALRVRAIDDSANAANTTRNVVVDGPFSVLGTEQPVVASADDGGSVELGLRFTPQADGYITGVRFFKGAANTGTHTGSLWAADGSRLAAVTFSGETASGWQTAKFAESVEVFAGTDYTVSYSAPHGGYSVTDLYWPYRAKASSPLAVAGALPGEPAGVYGAMGTHPTQSWRESNYYVDVVFDKSDASPLRIASRSPRASESSVALDTPVTLTFTRAAAPASVGIVVKDAAGTAVAGAVTYDAATKSARFAPSAPYAPATTYTVTPSATDMNGVALEAGSGWSFTTVAADLPAGTCPCSLFPESARPVFDSDVDSVLVTLGVKFTVDTPGKVSAIRFYKGTANTGTHTVTLWRTDGTVLSTGTATAESSHGWQTVTLAQPIAVAPGQTYIASYVAPNGGYSATLGQLGSQGYTRGPLSVPAQGAVFTYSSGFPDRSSSTNYFVDVVFDRAVAPPVPTTFAPAAGSDAEASATIAVTFNEPIVAGYSGTVRANGATVGGAWALSGNGRTLTFAPTAALPAGAGVTVGLTGLVGASGVAAADVSWSFSIANPAATVVTLFGNAVPQVAAETSDTASVELGVAFHSAVAGQIRAIRFYRGAGNDGTHVGSLWSPTGQRLATVTFVGETASGWQRALLATPVAIDAGAVYTVSYLAPQGRYSYTGAGLASPVTSGPLTTEAPGNGRYRYGGGGAMPTSSWNSTNYFVDVEFVATGGNAAPTTENQ